MKFIKVSYGKTATPEEKSYYFINEIVNITKQSTKNPNHLYCEDIQIRGNHYIIDIYHDINKKIEPRKGLTFVYLDKYPQYPQTKTQIAEYVFQRD